MLRRRFQSRRAQLKKGETRWLIAPDTSKITSAIGNFVSAYNTLIHDINAQYVVDPTGALPVPPLESDISLRSVQSSVLSDAAYAISGNSGYVNLASLGINTNNDGSLTVGTTPGGLTLNQVLAGKSMRAGR